MYVQLCWKLAFDLLDCLCCCWIGYLFNNFILNIILLFFGSWSFILKPKLFNNLLLKKRAYRGLVLKKCLGGGVFCIPQLPWQKGASVPDATYYRPRVLEDSMSSGSNSYTPTALWHTDRFPHIPIDYSEEIRPFKFTIYVPVFSNMLLNDRALLQIFKASLL